jgi:hypothetical protein
MIKEKINTMLTETQPPPLGTIWNVGAKVYNKKHALIGSCLDTPNAIAKMFMEMPEAAYIIQSKIMGSGKFDKDFYKDRMNRWNTASSMWKPL